MGLKFEEFMSHSRGSDISSHVSFTDDMDDRDLGARLHSLNFRGKYRTEQTMDGAQTQHLHADSIHPYIDWSIPKYNTFLPFSNITFLVCSGFTLHIISKKLPTILNKTRSFFFFGS